jgi:hypothetical protein
MNDLKKIAKYIFLIFAFCHHSNPNAKKYKNKIFPPHHREIKNICIFEKT